MKVLHVSHSDIIGGAARAAYRIYRAQAENGIDSQMLVHKSFSDEPGIEKINGGNLEADIRWNIERTINRYHGTEAWCSYNIIPSRLYKRICEYKPDLVNLHWVGAGAISIKQIGRMPMPTIWTFHDMWAFCGAEHYSDDGQDARFVKGYDRQKQTEETNRFDLGRLIWGRKRKHWRKPFTIVCPSKWLARCARDSVLFRDKQVEVVPYPIDLERWMDQV